MLEDILQNFASAIIRQLQEDRLLDQVLQVLGIGLLFFVIGVTIFLSIKQFGTFIKIKKNYPEETKSALKSLKLFFMAFLAFLPNVREKIQKTIVEDNDTKPPTEPKEPIFTQPEQNTRPPISTHHLYRYKIPHWKDVQTGLHNIRCDKKRQIISDLLRIILRVWEPKLVQLQDVFFNNQTNPFIIITEIQKLIREQIKESKAEVDTDLKSIFPPHIYNSLIIRFELRMREQANFTGDIWGNVLYLNDEMKFISILDLLSYLFVVLFDEIEKTHIMINGQFKDVNYKNIKCNCPDCKDGDN